MAAMHSDKDHQPNTTVAEIAGSCLRSFQECVRRAVSIHPRELSLVEDQLARFSVWAANIRVFSQGRASSDHRLREAPDVQDAVIGLLQALDYRIQNCTQCLESFSSRDPRMPLTDIDPKLDQSVRDIASEISLLHRFSNTIRRASHEAQNSKAAESFRIRDDEGNDAEALLTALFFYHVRDRFPTVGEHICQRLADTMVLRRKRILYKRSRYGDATIRPQQVPSQPRITLPKIRPRFAVADQSEAFEPQAIPTRSKSTVQSLTQSATTLSPEKFVKASAPSVVSVSKTVALSSHGDLIFPPAPLGKIKRKYNELKAFREGRAMSIGSSNSSLAAGMEFQVPNSHMERSAWRESVDAIGEVTCPFCFYALPAQDVVDNKKWKLHVKGDLEAYVCLFDDCSSAHELYGHSTSWLKHMREHAMRWRCTSKSHGDIVYESRDEYLSHMRSAHGGKFSEAQLRVLADRNGRVMGPLFKSCPLCAEGDVNGAMDDHIVGHLRFLALKSLPTYEDEGADDMGSEKGSSLASRPRSRSTIRDDPERGIPPTFDDSPQGKQVEVVVVERGVSRILELEDTHSGRSEWGFIPVPPETFRSAQDDPILQGFLNGDKEKKPLHPIPIRPGDASRDDKYFSHEGVGSYRRNHEITPSCTFCAKKGLTCGGRQDQDKCAACILWNQECIEPRPYEPPPYEPPTNPWSISPVSISRSPSPRSLLSGGLYPSPPTDAPSQSKGKAKAAEDDHGLEHVQEEILRVGQALPSMSWTSIDMDKLILQANMRGPWGSDRRNASYSKQVYFNVTVDVPPEYPIKGLLQFTIEKTPEMKDETREQLDANVKLLAHQYRGRNCLDVIFSYLAGLEEAPITTPYSGGRRIIDTARPFYSERGYASTQSSIPRRQIRSTEPNCSICHAPAELNCDCERKGFDVLVRQAEDKMMSSTYKDIKAWVRRHAQDFSANEYMELTREIRSRQQQGGEAGTAASGGTLSREEINRRWSSAISALPGALDYFYGLVEWKTPDDDDPAVKDPPLSSRPKRDTAQAAYAR